MLKDHLAALRRMRGLSQEELAEQMDVARQTLSKWESGESLPDIEKAGHLAEILGVSLDDLLSYDGQGSGLPLPPKGKHAFGVVTVGDKGQIVIPAKARKLFDIQPGDSLIVLGDELRGLAILPERYFVEFLNCMHRGTEEEL